jgi:hypothetical protein
LVKLCGALLGIGLLFPAGPVHAKKKKDASEATAVKKTPRLRPKGLRWGMKPKKVYKVYNKAIERDYVKRYQEVEPGVQMARLKEEIRQRKETFRLSYAPLDAAPSALDGTPFQNEFTYGNREGYMSIKRKKRDRRLFFIRNKLWKIVDVYKLGETTKWGISFKTATARINKLLGAEARLRDADPDAGRPFAEADWADGKTRLRLMNWGKWVGVAYISMSTERRLSDLRKSGSKKKDDLDPSVKGVLRDNKKVDGPGKDDGKKE